MTKRPGAPVPGKSTRKASMRHSPSTGVESPCRSGAPGHAAPGAAGAHLLADAAGWVPVTVFVDLPAQALVLACPSGARWTGYHHGVAGLCPRLGCTLPSGPPEPAASVLAGSLPRTPPHDGGTPVPLLASAPCHWHPRGRVLGLPADPRARAGRTYVELAAAPLAPCPLEHDPVLAAMFAWVTGTPVRR